MTTNDDIADALFRAIEAGDVDAVAGLYADDAVIWHNFDRVEQTRDMNLAVLTFVVRNLQERHYDDVVRHPIDGGFVQQHVLRGTTTAGVEVQVPACVVVKVADGKITRIDEYLDTRQIEPLTTASQ
jgi:ketosteroid isomerase-like protein